MRRLKLTLHYDGSGFHGWQVQPGLRTVQGELDAALSRLADRPTRSIAAGRTDAGVHATGQVASVAMPETWTAPALGRSLNAVLPEDIWAAGVEEMALDFHALRNAVARGYIYRIGTRPSARSPFRHRWCWPVRESLDRGVLDRGADAVGGNHSFRGYAKSGQPERGYLCHVRIARWVEWSGGVELRIVADRFLHHMVRYLVGTMVDAARDRRPEEDIPGLLREAGTGELETSPPAPAGGLFLAQVYYDDQHELEEPDNADLP